MSEQPVPPEHPTGGAPKKEWWRWARLLVRVLSGFVICCTIAWAALSMFGGVIPVGGGNNPGPTPTAVKAQDPENSPWPMVVHNSFGEVTITKQPTRAVALGLPSADALVAIGLTPAGIPDMTGKTTDGAAITPWMDDGLSIQKPELLQEADGLLPYDRIAELKPDVIFAVGVPLHEDQYKTLSRIAPTVAHPNRDSQTGWRETTRIIGAVMGKQKQADKVVHDTDAAITRARKAHPEFAGKTAAFTSVREDTGLRVYYGDDPTVLLLDRLGFAPLPKPQPDAAAFIPGQDGVTPALQSNQAASAGPQDTGSGVADGEANPSPAAAPDGASANGAAPAPAEASAPQEENPGGTATATAVLADISAGIVAAPSVEQPNSVLVPWDRLDAVDPDVLLTWFANDEMRGHTENNERFASLRAVRSGAFVGFQDPDTIFALEHPTALNIPWLVDSLVPRIGQAVGEKPTATGTVTATTTAGPAGTPPQTPASSTVESTGPRQQ